MEKNPAEKGQEEKEGQEKDLFVRIFRQLGAYKDPYQSISSILKETCDFFGFFCGFVYEADHTRIFKVQEHYQRHAVELRSSFVLEDFLSPEEQEELVKKNGEILYLDTRKTALGEKFLELFSARTLVMAPVIVEHNAPAAFVGMMDRRHPIRLSRKEINDTDAVLSVLAGHIKTRVYQRRLEYAHLSMRSILDNAGIDIYVSDFSTREILFANKSATEPYGGIEKITGKRCWEVFPADNSGPCSYCPADKLIDAGGNPTGTFGYDWQRPVDNQWFRVLSTSFYWVDGRIVQLSSSINITKNKDNEALIRTLAEHDPLTSLYNRRKFIEDFEAGIARLRAEGADGYLLFIDLDDFKRINDTQGHLNGDLLLATIAEFLCANAQAIGTPYRYGGDEFVVFAERKSLADLDSTRALLLDRFSREWNIRGRLTYCSISIGAVAIPQADANAAELIERADMAMYAVKKSGKHGFRLSGGGATRLIDN